MLALTVTDVNIPESCIESERERERESSGVLYFEYHNLQNFQSLFIKLLYSTSSTCFPGNCGSEEDTAGECSITEGTVS